MNFTSVATPIIGSSNFLLIEGGRLYITAVAQHMMKNNYVAN